MASFFFGAKGESTFEGRSRFQGIVFVFVFVFVFSNFRLVFPGPCEDKSVRKTNKKGNNDNN